MKFLMYNRVYFYLLNKAKVRFYCFPLYRCVFALFYRLGTLFSPFSKHPSHSRLYVDLLPTSYGHIFAELDLCLRLSPQNSVIQVLHWPTYLTRSISRGLDPSIIKLTDSLYDFCRISFISGLNKSVFVSISISHTHHHPDHSSHLLDISLDTVETYDSYFQRDIQCMSILDSPSSSKLSHALTRLKRVIPYKYVVIQYKDVLVNGTAVLIPPYYFSPIFQFLHKNGYKIIFCGREEIPTAWKNLGVISSSDLIPHSLFSDTCLVAFADFVITSASGFAFLASSLDKKLMYCNNWHYRVPQPGINTISVPTKISKDSQYLSVNDCLSYKQLQSLLH